MASKYNQKPETVSLEEATEMQKKLVKFHLSRLKFKPVVKNGMQGIDLNSRDCIEGLILHMDYIVNITSLAAIEEVRPFFNDLSKMLNAQQPPRVICEFLETNLPELTNKLIELVLTCQGNTEIIREKLGEIGWSGEMM